MKPCGFFCIFPGKFQKVTCLEEVQESGILEARCGGYVFADDTGYFSVGEVRGESMNINTGYLPFMLKKCLC